jgi:hypothetical protein
MKSNGSGNQNPKLTAVRTRCAYNATPLYSQKLALTSTTRDGRSVGIVPLWTQGHRVCFVSWLSRPQDLVRLERFEPVIFRHVAQWLTHLRYRMPH